MVIAALSIIRSKAEEKADILQTSSFNTFYRMKDPDFLSKLGPINPTPALVHVMTWHHTGIQSLHEPMTAKFTGASIYLWPNLNELRSHNDMGIMKL